MNYIRDLIRSMSQNSAQMQELAIHLSQQISNVFGASYCRIALCSASRNPWGANINADSGAAVEIMTLPLTPTRSAGAASLVNGNSAAREAKITEPFTPGAELIARINSVGHRAHPRLSFYWRGQEAQQEHGCLEIHFNAPRSFSATEVSALLLMAEIARTMLMFARVASLQTTAAEQVVKKLQSDIFTMPFLEAKKIWIDAFEHEYLRQQMIKFFGNISKAARAARISRYTLYALLNKFQFSAQSFKRMKPQKSSLGRGVSQNGRKKSETQEVLRELLAPLV